MQCRRSHAVTEKTLAQANKHITSTSVLAARAFHHMLSSEDVVLSHMDVMPNMRMQMMVPTYWPAGQCQVEITVQQIFNVP